MIIMTQADWWRLARKTVPHLKGFGAEHGVYFNQPLAMGCLNAASHLSLQRALTAFMRELPHSQLEKKFPFDDLCDLCSEYQRVFQTQMESDNAC
jgi:hypothetical protein